MIRKIISCALCALLALYTGCYSTVTVTPDEFRENADTSDVTVTMKDASTYTFLEGNYQIDGDSLKGFGLRGSGSYSTIVLDASLSSKDFESMEVDQFSTVKTAVLGGSIAIVTLIFLKMILDNQNLETAVSPSGWVGP
jgi:hypothetical protein